MCSHGNTKKYNGENQLPFYIFSGLMMTVALTFFMNSIKASSPGIAQAVTKMSYISVLFAVQAIINQDVSTTSNYRQ